MPVSSYRPSFNWILIEYATLRVHIASHKTKCDGQRTNSCEMRSEKQCCIPSLQHWCHFQVIRPSFNWILPRIQYTQNKNVTDKEQMLVNEKRDTVLYYFLLKYSSFILRFYFNCRVIIYLFKRSRLIKENENNEIYAFDFFLTWGRFSIFISNPPND